MLKGQYIVFDLDGVLCELQRVAINLLRKETGYRFNLSEWTAWDSIFVKAQKHTRKSPEELKHIMFGEHAIQLAKPTKGSQDTISKLTKMGLSVVVATARSLLQKRLTLEFIGNYFPEISPKHVFLKPDNVNTDNFKLAVMIQFGAIALVEDSAETVAFCFDKYSRQDTLFFVPAKRWNLHVLQNPRIIRHGNWRKDTYNWEKLIKRLVF